MSRILRVLGVLALVLCVVGATIAPSVIAAQEVEATADQEVVEPTIVVDETSVVSEPAAPVVTEVTPSDPVVEPTLEPTVPPTIVPTVEPTSIPTAIPTVEPTSVPVVEPTMEPTSVPTQEPMEAPTEQPTVEPTIEASTDNVGSSTPEPTKDLVAPTGADLSPSATQGSITIQSDTDGKAHAWAPVNVYVAGNTEPVNGGLLNAEGNLTLNDIPFGNYTITVESHDIYRATTVPVEVIDTAPDPIVIVSYSTYELSTVTILGGENGEDHAGQLAYLFPVGPGEGIYGELKSDGSAIIPDVPYGDYTLMIAAHGPYADVSQVVTIQADAENVAPNYTLTPTGEFAILGGDQGDAHSGARVNLTPRPRTPGVASDGVLDATGSFTFTGVPHGVYDLTISAHPGYAEFTQIVWIPDTGSVTPVYARDQSTLAVVSLSVKPESAQAGSVISVSGTGYQPSEQVVIRWHRDYGDVLGTFTTNAEGSFSGNVTVPATALVTRYWIVATGEESGIRSQFSLEITAMAPVELSTSPTTAQAGSTVSLSGSGYQPGETIVVRWHRDYGEILGTFYADSNGEFAGEIEIPATALVSRYWIVATGERSGQRGQFSFAVSGMAAVQLSTNPVSARAGSVVQLTGSGFQPGETVTIRWHRDTGDVLATLFARSDGTISGSVTIPETAQVTRYWLVAEGSRSGQRGQLSFAVSGLAVVHVSTSPISARAGSTVTVTGSGFSPGETVTIKWHRDYGAVLATTSARSDGTIRVNITIPVTAQQTRYWIIADGSRSGQSGKFNFHLW